MTEDFVEEDGELAAHHHQETFDTDVLSLSGLEELELTFRDFHESSETGIVMTGLMSPGTSMTLIIISKFVRSDS